MSNFYDDGEFAAIKLVRLAHEEWEDSNPRSVEMHAVVFDMFERHGQNGIDGLAVAMARQYYTALRVLAENKGQAVTDLMDDFEQHKLGQIDDESRED